MVEFPAFNGQSDSYVVLQYPTGSVNPFHTHPRATELLFLTYSVPEVGFVGTTNKLFTQRLQAGDIFVFLKGLVHYQFNCAENDSMIVSTLNKLLASWLLSTINVSLLSSFTAAKTACDIWSTANRLFAASTGAKISRIKHELHSLKKGTLPPLVQNTYALLEASGSVVLEAKKVEVILAGLPSDFDAVLTLASFSLETLSFQQLVKVLWSLSLVRHMRCKTYRCMRIWLKLLRLWRWLSRLYVLGVVVASLLARVGAGFVFGCSVKSAVAMVISLKAGPQIAYGPCVQSHNGRDYGSNLGHGFGHGMERDFGPSFGRDVQREFGRNLGQQQFEPTARVPSSRQHNGFQVTWRTKPRAQVFDFDSLQGVGLPQIPNFCASNFSTATQYDSNFDNTDSYVPVEVRTPS
ncbi:hypothetical protein Goklo_026118 [Gossypium klotzschianum]|uniref:Cupin type-1 domain-containing protein n=1 Tax=Gossypium klotzschianum TaxID=34286 RepID=A0A7J8TTT4_9ROSI|nr:hypothetical protein [Gossypium klotzschianum]